VIPLAEAAEAAGHFAVEGDLVLLLPHTSGLINRSWIAGFGGPGGVRRYLLQRINRYVFRRPEEVMENMVRVTGHVASGLAREGVADVSRRVLTLVPTREGASHHVDAGGEVWRLLVLIEGTRSTEHAETPEQARETARAFGRYIRQLQDLPGPRLFETIPAFHDTPARLAALERALSDDARSRAAEAGAEIEAVLDRRRLAFALADRVARGELVERPTHNDAKIANILFDEATGEALCVVDLDTVMPGLALHDFGDLARSMTSGTAEDETDLGRIAVRVPMFEALARGFVEGAGEALSPLERSLLVTAAQVITLEQAARFLTDHLQGDLYYRITHPGHNLERTRAQQRLLESLERNEPELSRLVGAP
jgi:aminoglycoside phosphotransferase (APT) family kinase protein